VLPEPHGAPAATSDEDNWSWLVTFSDLVLQLFGFAIIAALGGAAAHGAAAPTALEAAVLAPASESKPSAPAGATIEAAAVAVRVSEPVAEPEPDADVAPQAARGGADAVPAYVPLPSAPAASVDPATQSAPAAPARDMRMAALGGYVEHLVALQADLAATVTTRDDDVVVKIGDVAGFAPGSADPSRAMRPLLAELRSIVAASPDLRVEVSGHTDDVPIKTPLFPSNLELSLARASHVAHELVADDKELAARVSAAGYGEQRPIASNGDAAGRARNRRVEIRLTRAG